MSPGPANRGRRSSAKSIIAVVSCVVGLGLVLFGFGMASKSPKTEASADGGLAAESERKKPLRAWNMALGSVVVVAQELGFSIRAAKDTQPGPSKLATRIESQLQKLRELYRQESEKHPELMGGMTLQFNVNSSGDVTQVKEIGSRISDTEFKKAVIAEVSKWTFQELFTETVTVTCPLLFVPEGMDITTLVQWEKSLSQLGDKHAFVKNNAPAVQQAKMPEAPKRTEPPAKVVAAKPEAAKEAVAQVKIATPPQEKPPEKLAENPRANPASNFYKIKYPTTIRKEPNFKSPGVAKFTKGTKVMLVGKSGDWWEVRYHENGPSGFLRREFLTPLELAQK